MKRAIIGSFASFVVLMMVLTLIAKPSRVAQNEALAATPTATATPIPTPTPYLPCTNYYEGGTACAPTAAPSPGMVLAAPNGSAVNSSGIPQPAPLVYVWQLVLGFYNGVTGALGSVTMNNGAGLTLQVKPNPTASPTAIVITGPPTNGNVGQFLESDAGAGTGWTFANTAALWAGTSATISSSTTDYIAFGENPAIAVIGTEANSQNNVPMAGTAYNLQCFTTTACQAGGVVFTLRQNGAGSALTCTCNATGDTTHCTDTTHTVTLAAKDLISVQVANSNAASATGVTGCSLVIH